MSGLLDLPLETRLKIFSDYRSRQAPFWLAVTNHPAVSLVNRQLRQESLAYYYRHYRWSFSISVSPDGRRAHMNRNLVRYLQAMEQADQLWRIQKVRIMYAFPGVEWFQTTSDDPALQPYDVQYPKRVCFYHTFCDILCRAPMLGFIEFAWIDNAGNNLHTLSSEACVQHLNTMPKTCEYRLMQGSSNSASTPIKVFAKRIEEATGKTIEIHS